MLVQRPVECIAEGNVLLEHLGCLIELALRTQQIRSGGALEHQLLTLAVDIIAGSSLLLVAPVC
jgi:hypothetical protein